MSRESEQERQKRMTMIERPFWAQGRALAGMDEVGRGPLAGPVVTACVILGEEPLVDGVNDSKKVAEKKREAIYEQLVAHAVSFGIGSASHEEIDSINILNATKLAMCRAFEAMDTRPTDILIDAVCGLKIPANQHPFIKGDSSSYLIAAASILAKVTRDRLMIEYDAIYPDYGFAQHKGYGTPAHIAALERFGPCPIHRHTFIGKFIDARGCTDGQKSNAGRNGRDAGRGFFAEEGL